MIIPGATFTPVFGSDMMGILSTPNGAMMTYSIGESVNNNSPIKFKKVYEAGEEVALLTFRFSARDFKKELGLNPEEKVESICGEQDDYFYLVVDKNGIPKGELYDSTLNRYLPATKFDRDLEAEFIFRALAKYGESFKTAEKHTSYLFRLACYIGQ